MRKPTRKLIPGTTLWAGEYLFAYDHDQCKLEVEKITG